MRTRNVKKNKQRRKTRGGMFQYLNERFNPWATSTYGIVTPSVMHQGRMEDDPSPDALLKCERVRNKLKEFDALLEGTAHTPKVSPSLLAQASTEPPLVVDDTDKLSELHPIQSKNTGPILEQLYNFRLEMKPMESEQDRLEFFKTNVKPYLIRELNKPYFQKQTEVEVSLGPTLQKELLRTTPLINEELYFALTHYILNADYQVLISCFNALQRLFPTQFMAIKSSLADIATKVTHEQKEENGLEVQKTIADKIRILLPIQPQLDTIMLKVHEIQESLKSKPFSKSEKELLEKVLAKLLIPEVKDDMVQYFQRFLNDKESTTELLYYFLGPYSRRLVQRVLEGTDVPEIVKSEEVASLLKKFYSSLSLEPLVNHQIVQHLFDVYVTTLQLFLKSAIQGETKEAENNFTERVKDGLLYAIKTYMDRKNQLQVTGHELERIGNNGDKLIQIMGGKAKRKTRRLKKRRTRHVNRKR